MSYSIEEDGTRRYRITSEKEIVSPPNGHDYSIDHVRSRLGFMATVSGRIYRPIDRPARPLKVVNANGFMATSDIYDDVAIQMASMGEDGADTAVFDTWHLMTCKDYDDPLLVASMGGKAMFDIMEDLTQESGDYVATGHSMGGPVAARLLAHDPRVGYWLGDAPAGIEHENMTKVHIENGKEIIFDEAIPIGKYAARKVGAIKLATKYLKRLGMNPSQALRQAYLLCTESDITPLLTAAREKEAMHGVILHEFDAFFKISKQLDEINKKSELFDVVKVSEGTKHGHANTHARENGLLRMEVINQMRSERMARRAILATAAN